MCFELECCCVFFNVSQTLKLLKCHKTKQRTTTSCSFRVGGCIVDLLGEGRMAALLRWNKNPLKLWLWVRDGGSDLLKYSAAGKKYRANSNQRKRCSYGSFNVNAFVHLSTAERLPHRWCHPAGRCQAAPGQCSSCCPLFRCLDLSISRSVITRSITQMWQHAVWLLIQGHVDVLLEITASSCVWHGAIYTQVEFQSVVSVLVFVLTPSYPSSSACCWGASWWSCRGWGGGPDWSAISSECFQSVWDQESWTAASWATAAAAGWPLTRSSHQSRSQGNFLKGKWKKFTF